MAETNNQEVAWGAPEYDHAEKDSSWYWVSIIVAVLLLAAAMWQQNFLFGLFIVIAEVLFMVWGGKAPRTVRFTTTTQGLEIDTGKRYRWSDFKTFSVDLEHHKDAEWTDIHLTFRAHLRPPFRVKVGVRDIDRVRESLSLHIPEIEHQPSLTDALEKWTGF